MIKIGIDARLYFQTGVGVYLRNFLYYLQKIAPSGYSFFIYVLKEDVVKINFSNKRFHKRPVVDRWHTFGEQTNFLREVQKDNLDLMHFTYFGYPVLYSKRFIVTIHDLTPLFFKTGQASTRNPLLYDLKHAAFRYVVTSQVKKSRFIITPTQTIKSQIGKFFGSQYKAKTKAIYEGVSREILSAKENKSLRNKFRKPFFLYVSNFYPHKNAERLIMAFSGLSEGAQLVLVGPDDYFAKRIQKLISKLRLEQKVILHTNPRIGDFTFFYKHALALVHPSLAEGFGLPLVEAMHFKLPIIASNIDVFKEVLDEQYLAFDPYDVEEIRNTLQSFLKKRVTFDYTKLLPQFSFAEMTKKTLEVYNKAIDER